MNSKVNSSRMTFVQAILLLSFVCYVAAQFSMPNAFIINNPNTGKSYAVFRSCANYLTAKGICEDEPNTHLIHLETETEQEWLYQQFVSIGLPTRFWIGLEMTDGMWTWVDSLTSTPIQGSHRISGYNPYGPKYCLADGDINWIQMHNANCFPYVCEHSTPVTESSSGPVTSTTATTSISTPTGVTESSSGPVTSTTATTSISTPTGVTETSTDETASTVMHKYSGTIENAALFFAEEMANTVSCARKCFDTDKCIASQFDTSKALCSMYGTGSLTLGCGVDAVTLCHVHENVVIGIP